MPQSFIMLISTISLLLQIFFSNWGRKVFKATRAVTVNRKGNSLKDTKQKEKMDSGSMDISSTSFLCAVKVSRQ